MLLIRYTDMEGKQFNLLLSLTLFGLGIASEGKSQRADFDSSAAMRAGFWFNLGLQSKLSLDSWDHLRIWSDQVRNVYLNWKRKYSCKDVMKNIMVLYLTGVSVLARGTSAWPSNSNRNLSLQMVLGTTSVSDGGIIVTAGDRRQVGDGVPLF